MNKVLTQYTEHFALAVTIRQKEVKNYSDGKNLVQTPEAARSYGIPYYHIYYLRYNASYIL